MVLGAQHHDRHGAQLTDAFEGLPTVEARHRDIENHEIGLLGVEQSQPLAPVAGLDHRVAGSLQHLPEQAADIRVVVDYEHRGHSSSILKRPADGRRFGAESSLAGGTFGPFIPFSYWKPPEFHRGVPKPPPWRASTCGTFFFPWSVALLAASAFHSSESSWSHSGSGAPRSLAPPSRTAAGAPSPPIHRSRPSFSPSRARRTAPKIARCLRQQVENSRARRPPREARALRRGRHRAAPPPGSRRLRVTLRTVTETCRALRRLQAAKFWRGKSFPRPAPSALAVRRASPALTARLAQPALKAIRAWPVLRARRGSRAIGVKQATRARRARSEPKAWLGHRARKVTRAIRARLVRPEPLAQRAPQAQPAPQARRDPPGLRARSVRAAQPGHRARRGSRAPRATQVTPAQPVPRARPDRPGLRVRSARAAQPGRRARKV